MSNTNNKQKYITMIQKFAESNKKNKKITSKKREEILKADSKQNPKRKPYEKAD